MASNGTPGRKVAGHKTRRRRHAGSRDHATVAQPERQQAKRVTTADTGNEGALPALYEVQPTDTAERIADRFGASLGNFLAVNPEITKVGRMFTGQIVQVPLTPPVLPFVTRAATEYVAQEGDTLFSVAQKFRIGLPSLQKVNPLVTPDRIFAGQMLLVPTVGEPPVSTLPGLLYVVQSGDTLPMVAGLFGLTTAAITAANPQRVKPAQLDAGEIIVLPVAGIPGEPVFTRVRYIVQPMDTLDEIVRQFEVWPFGLTQYNAIVAAVPGLILQLPPSIPIPAPPQTPAGIPSCHPAPFGKQLTLSDDDTAFVAFPADFHFEFYGQAKPDGIWVNSNGNVTFGEGDPMFFPTTDAFLEGPPRIALFWTDLVPEAAVGTGGVFTDFFFDTTTGSTRLAVTWDRVPILGIDRFNTFQLVLSQDGTIELCYFDIAPLPAENTPRVLAGLAPSSNQPGGNVFLYTGEVNQRRAGESSEPIPMGSLTGRVLTYRYTPESGGYRMIFS